MSPDEIKALRGRLGCTAKELARALELEPATIGEWERGEAFPTKRFVDALTALDRKGPGSVPRLAGKRARPRDPMAALADPEIWTLVRKLLAHPELRDAAIELSAQYEDPAAG